MIRAGQLYAAKQKLESLKAANPRVWGLDRQIAQVQEAIAKAERLIAQGDATLLAREPRTAYAHYSEASALASDYPGLATKLENLKKQLWEAKALFEQASAVYREDEWEKARDLVNQSLNLNPQSRSAQRLHAELAQGLVREAGEQRTMRLTWAIGAGAIVVALALGGTVIWVQMPPKSPDRIAPVSRPSTSVPQALPVTDTSLADQSPQAPPPATQSTTSQPATSLPTIAPAASPPAIPPTTHPATTAPSSVALDPADLFAMASPAVVRVIVRDKSFRETGMGSGFFVSSDGLLVTNFHVINGAESASVILGDNTRLFVNGVMAVDQENDLAILKVNGTDLPTLTLADAEPKIGAKVYAIGNPEGLTNTLSEGLVSAIRRNQDGRSVIQTTAAISHGSSGGPLMIANGQVIGVTSFQLLGGQNLNFAYPAAKVDQLLHNHGKITSLASAGGKPLNKDSAAQIDRIWKLVEKKNWQPALALLIQLRPSFEDDAFYWFTVGHVHYEMGHYDLAIESYNASLKLRPDSAVTLNNLGVCYAIHGRYTEAIIAYQAAIALTPEEATVYCNLGESYSLMALYPDAVSAFKTAIRLRPDYFEALVGLGSASLNADDVWGAINAFRSALAIQPRSPEALKGVGAVQVKQGHFSEAAATFRTVIAIDPKDADARFRLGNVYWAQGRYSEAVSAYQQAVALQPDEPLYHYSLGAGYSRIRNYREAINEWRTVMRLDPKSKIARQAAMDIEETIPRIRR